MKDKDLLKHLNALGFPLFEEQKEVDANLVLAQIVKNKNPRFLEGFPVVLANSAKRNLFDYHKTVKHLKGSDHRNNFADLFLMSLALYKTLKLTATWVKKLNKQYPENKKNKYFSFLDKMKNDQPFKAVGFQMDSKRLKSTFSNYYSEKFEESVEGLLSQREEFDLEYSLSQVFSPKQKELFLKKLKGKKMSKTEKEYFSRVVRKKVKALANSQLHRLSRKLIG